MRGGGWLGSAIASVQRRDLNPRTPLSSSQYLGLLVYVRKQGARSSAGQVPRLWRRETKGRKQICGRKRGVDVRRYHASKKKNQCNPWQRTKPTGTIDLSTNSVLPTPASMIDGHDKTEKVAEWEESPFVSVARKLRAASGWRTGAYRGREQKTKTTGGLRNWEEDEPRIHEYTARTNSPSST